MKFTDLTKEQQEHFQGVAAYYGDGLPEDATHVDFDLAPTISGVLLKEDSYGIFFWDYADCVWVGVTEPATNFYPVPDKPWYDPEDVVFKPESRIDVIGQNGNDGEHYEEETVKETIKPKDMTCFDQVANVIGEECAEEQLQKVIDCVDCHGSYPVTSLLVNAFVWGTSPQGRAYWASIDSGVVPKENQSLRAVDKETTEAIQEAVKSGNVEFEDDMVSKPNHYQLLPEYEVKGVLKAVLDKIEDSDFDMSLYEAGWYQQSMQYFLRFHGKNGLEDLEKGVQTMQFVIDSIKKKRKEG